MGKVTVDAKLTNHLDFMTGRMNVRVIELPNVIVDSGATMLSLHKDIIDDLGLEKIRESMVNTATGQIMLDIYSVVDLEILGRTGTFEVMELKHPKIKALIGQLPLERLDFLIHPGINRIIPNPEHDNQLVLDQLITDEILAYNSEIE